MLMATRGWKNTMDSTSDVSGAPNFIIATGGTITCCGDYKIHTLHLMELFQFLNAGTSCNQ
jgi:L-asparaginase/Glu-tRNA(Gln) amidotransferase subunit D